MNSNRQLDNQINTLFKDRYLAECKRVNHFMMWLMVAQWIAGIAFAVFYSPLTWIGQSYEIHIHVWAAVLLGGSISGFAILWTRLHPDATHSRHVMAVAQILWSALLIHLTGGRIETHFHVFASLAILSIYRDWRILITATAVIAIDHFVRGVFYPLSAFGVVTASPFRWIEHAGWVCFEVAFLAPACIRLRNELRELCLRQTQMEKAKRSVDKQVDKRTKELMAANALLAETKNDAEKLALVARYTANAVMITDGKSRIEWVNEGFTRVSGYSMDEVVGRKPAEFQHGAKTDPTTINIMRSALENKIGFDVEVIYYRKDCHPYWLAIECRPIRNEKGEVTRFIAIQTDITSRKAMEMSLAAAEKRLRSLVDNVPGSLFRCQVDEELTMLFMSKSISEISGYEAEEFVQTRTISHAELVHVDDKLLVNDAIKRAILNQESYKIEYRLIDREGNLKWVWERGQCYANEDGTLVLDGMIFDITERKLTEAEVASKGTLIEESLNEIFIFDADTLLFKYVNRAGRENIGYDLAELQQMTPLNIKSGIDLVSFAQLIQPLRCGEQQQLVFQTQHVRKDNSRYDTEVRLQKSRYRDQDVFLAMILDVTDRISAEAKSSQLQKELVDASRKAGMAEVATGVLHNVGNILNSVNVSASLIQNRFNKSVLSNLERVSGLIKENEQSFADFVRDDNRGQKVPSYIQKITDALGTERSQIVQEFGGLVKNIDHIKRIISVQQTTAKTSGLIQELIPQEIIDDVLTATQSSRNCQRIQVVQQVERGLPTFFSDKHKILQVLVNLIGNASDALTEHQIASPVIEIQVVSSNDQIIFRVIDNGIGIPADRIDKIFQHGFTTKESGHGFGLHSSANAATELGGTLSVSSDGDCLGAVFELAIPISSNSFQATNAPQTAKV